MNLISIIKDDYFITIKIFRIKLVFIRKKNLVNQYKKQVSILNATNKKLDVVAKEVHTLLNKINLDLSDNIFEFQNVRIYLKYYPLGILERKIVDTVNFYEIEILEKLNSYLNSESVIFDIGANIGNHTIYWALKSGVKKVHSFEPAKGIYSRLIKNIELNNLKDVVIPHNYALGDKRTIGKLFFQGLPDVGSGHVHESGIGVNVEIYTLDEMVEEKVDLIKIDVEGFECAVLRGGKKFIEKHKPVIMIESSKENFDEMNQILTEYKYRIEEKHDSKNYTYIPAYE